MSRSEDLNEHAGRPPGFPIQRLPGAAWMAAALLTGLAGSLEAAPDYPTRTQQFDLKEGWNAVFLEVEPADPAPGTIFAGTPVDVVAQFLRPVRTAQFATDPGEELANVEGWGIWYGPDREENLLSSLFALHSHSALLVHSREDFTWSLSGQVFHKRIHWKPDSFSLVGFPIDPDAAPTFAEFFQGVPAHAGMPVYRLVEGRWKKVERPAETVMRRGEAYWVFSKGGSDYQGPLDVRLPFGDHLRFRDDRTTTSLSLHNRSPHPASVTIDRSGGLPLDFVFKGVYDTGVSRFTTPLPERYSMPAMEGGVEGSVSLRLPDFEGIDDGGSGLLKISTDSGVAYWIAIFAEGSDDS